MLLSHEVVFRSILPLLHTRKELDKSINKITSPDVGKRAKTSSSVSEKRDLSYQISSLLQVMIPKLQLMKVDAPDLSACNVLTTQLMEEYKKCDTLSSRLCINKLFSFVVKTINSCNDNSKECTSLLQSNFVPVVKEWSTKRTTKISPSIFLEFINVFPR